MNFPLLSSLNVFRVPVILTLSPGFNSSTKSSSKTKSICFGSVPPDRFSKGSCILAFCVSMYLESSWSNLKDLPPHSLHNEGSVIWFPECCSTSVILMQPLHSNFAVSIRGRISSVFLTIPSADTKLPIYLLKRSLNGMLFVRFSNLMFNWVSSFINGSIFLIAFCEAAITSSGFVINKSAKSGSNFSKSS